MKDECCDCGRAAENHPETWRTRATGGLGPDGRCVDRSSCEELAAWRKGIMGWLASPEGQERIAEVYGDKQRPAMKCLLCEFSSLLLVEVARNRDELEEPGARSQLAFVVGLMAAREPPVFAVAVQPCSECREKLARPEISRLLSAVERIFDENLEETKERCRR